MTLTPLIDGDGRDFFGITVGFAADEDLTIHWLFTLAAAYPGMGLAIGGYHATVFDFMIAHREMGVPLQDAKQRRTGKADFPNPQLALGAFGGFLAAEADDPKPMDFRGVPESQITLTPMARVEGGVIARMSTSIAVSSKTIPR